MTAYRSKILLVFIILITLPMIASAQNIYPINLDAALARQSIVEWTQQYETVKAEMSEFQVESVEEFIKINEFYRAFVNDGETIHSFALASGEKIACIDIRTQGALVSAGIEPQEIQRQPVAVPLDRRTNYPTLDFGLDGSLDADRHVRSCPTGSFPKLILPVEQFYRYAKLGDIFRKYPSKAYTHEYAHAYQVLDNTGEVGDFNLWAPEVETSGQFSLAQLWVARGYDTDLQTVETGWQVYQGLYDNTLPNLFIFFTTDGYQSGCYNLMCGAFVQVDNTVVIGGPFQSHSQPEGNQVTVTLGLVRDGDGGNHWWLKVNDKWVGYYPNNRFDDEGIAEYGELIDFGGELIDSSFGGHTSSEMGSGEFPSAGYGKAAFIRQIQYVDFSGTYQDADQLIPQSTVPECWDIAPIEYDDDSQWSTFFYFGGACGACTGCIINNYCWQNGDRNPQNPCEACDAATAIGNWTTLADGETCDDELWCNGEDSCSAGVCIQHTGSPCDDNETCDETNDTCTISDDDDDVAADDDDTSDFIDPNDTADDDDDDDDDDNDDGCGC